MGLFTEDADINADKLIRIWVSEGFLKTTSHKKLEEVAEECLVDLVSRSLIIVSRRGASGKIRSCRIHDLVRLLCLREGEDAKFFHVKGKCFKVSPEGKQVIRRLCLHPDDLQNKNLGLEKDSLDSVRTILCLGEPNTYLEDPECCKKINSRFQLLRVLDLESIRFSCFPSEITQLVQLRYVACTTGTDVPASISNLWNLQTLINQLSLPQEVWKLSSLRHFNPGGMCVHAPSITHNILGLENLETVDSTRTANSNWKEIFSAVPRVQKLGVLIHPDHNGWSKFIGSLVSLADLQKLRIHLAIPSSGRNWNLNEGGFMKLKLLHIFMTNLVHWEATSDSLPSLECLILRHCYYLEVPTEIGDIPTLELIEHHYCSQASVTSAEEILEEEQSYGNEILVVRTCNTGVQYFDMKREGDEEVAVASTNESDMTYNHTSNMASNVVAKMRAEVINVKSEDLMKLIGQHKNRCIEDEELIYLHWAAANFDNTSIDSPNSRYSSSDLFLDRAANRVEIWPLQRYQVQKDG
ncbi:putative late blight resistance protein homolog R1A-10 [Lycium barbarum]|uniref:putative late blight resistance protein homolog R1A-10 n=1 Tax=Lycium barbarum TaxID=112863 RepID=UPI00293F6E32|nr:putative late blight resistance protein homolog R1A-10 [Lycium barbarum]